MLSRLGIVHAWSDNYNYNNNKKIIITINSIKLIQLILIISNGLCLPALFDEVGEAAALCLPALVDAVVEAVGPHALATPVVEVPSPHKYTVTSVENNVQYLLFIMMP